MAIDQVKTVNVPIPVMKEVGGKEFVSYGDRNGYPDWLYDVYVNNASLQSIIQGTVDYVLGNNIITTAMSENEARELIEKSVADYLIFGGFYWQVIRNNDGSINTAKWMDFRNVRMDKERNRFWYSEDWSKSYGRVKTIEYPVFEPNRPDPSSVIFVCTPGSREVYPTPMWSGAIKAAVISNKIDEFHLSEIDNNFMSSAVINLNNGIPTDEVKREIEKNFESKFGGAENSGRLVLVFNDSAENAAKIERLATDDFDKRYEALAKRVREQTFVAFRAIPALFGLMTESTGFNEQEFSQSFKLYNRTAVRPIQQKIVNLFEKLFGVGSLVIDPFTLGTEESNNDTENNVQ